MNPFGDWAAVVVAADFRSATGDPAEVFDNGRRDIARALVARGFQPANMAQFSVRPARYPDARPSRVSNPQLLLDELSRLTARAKGGCLVYFTSHGNQDGIVYGELIATPAAVKQLLDRTCGARPTVVVISACFSGVFIPALRAPNRVVMTAARADRASFGCGNADVYTFYDACFLESLPTSGTIDVLARRVRACVAKRETELKMSPPSEPQVSVGAGIAALLPLLRLDRQPPG